MSFLQKIIVILKGFQIFVSLLIPGLKYKFFTKKNIEDEENIVGKVVVITGANRGIGKAAANEFAKRGAKVVMGCVDLKEGAEALEEIKRQTGNENLDMIYLDLSEMSSVRKFANEVIQKYPEIKVLVNNAGLGAASMGNVKTKDGFNLHVAVNHLGHFLLTNLLLKNLQKGNSARVVSMSSTLQLFSNLELDDLMMDKRDIMVDQGLPYANTKFCNALFIQELGKRVQGTGVTSYALCPGIVRTAIYDSILDRIERGIARVSVFLFGTEVEEAANEILYFALSKGVGNETGRMYIHRQPFELCERRLNPDLAEKLWAKSAQLTQLEDD